MLPRLYFLSADAVLSISDDKMCVEHMCCDSYPGDGPAPAPELPINQTFQQLGSKPRYF